MADKYVSAFEIGGQDYFVKDSQARQLQASITALQSAVGNKVNKDVYETFENDVKTKLLKLDGIQEQAKNVLYADWSRNENQGTTVGGGYVVGIKKPTNLSEFLAYFKDDTTGLVDASKVVTNTATDERLSTVINGLNNDKTFRYGSVKDAADKIVHYDNPAEIMIPKKIADLEDGDSLGDLPVNLTKFRDRFGLNADLTEKTPEEKAESNDILQTDDVYAEGVFNETTQTWTPKVDFKNWNPGQYRDAGEWKERPWDIYYQEHRPEMSELFNTHLSPINTVNKDKMRGNVLGQPSWLGNRPVEAAVLADEFEKYVKKDGTSAYYEGMHVGTADEALNIAGDVNVGGEFYQRKSGNVADIMDFRKQISLAGAKYYKGHISSSAEYTSKIIDMFASVVPPFKKGSFWNVTTSFVHDGVQYNKYDIIIYNGRDDNTSYIPDNYRIFRTWGDENFNARITSIRGNTLVYNQQLPKTGNLVNTPGAKASQSGCHWLIGKSASTTAKPATTVKKSDDVLEITLPATISGKSKKAEYKVVAWDRNDYFQPAIGHKYLFIVDICTEDMIDFILADAVTQSRSKKKYGTWNTDYTKCKYERYGCVFSFQSQSMMDYDIGFRNRTTSLLQSRKVRLKQMMIIDLTQMFGFGKEPDYGELRTILPDRWYDQTAQGTLVPVNITNKSSLISQSANLWDGSYTISDNAIVTYRIPVIPYHQYVFRWNPRGTLNTGGVQIKLYYDPDGTGEASATLQDTKYVSSSDYIYSGYANMFVIHISATTGRTIEQAVAELDRLSIVPYNAYNDKLIDTEHWLYKVDFLPSDSATYTLRATETTYDELTPTTFIKRIGKGTLKITQTGSGSSAKYSATLSCDDGAPVNGRDYKTPVGNSDDLGSITSATTFTLDNDFTYRTYPYRAGTYVIYYRLKNPVVTPVTGIDDEKWKYRAAYNGIEYFFYDGTTARKDSSASQHNFYTDGTLKESNYIDKTLSPIYPLVHAHQYRLDQTPHWLDVPKSAPPRFDIEYEYDTAQSVSKLVSFPDMRFGEAVLTSAKRGSISSTTISFGHTFEDVPQIYITPMNGTRVANFGNVSYHVTSRTRTHFTVIYSNNSSGDHNTWLSWMAVCTKTNKDMNVSSTEEIEVPEPINPAFEEDVEEKDV